MTASQKSPYASATNLKVILWTTLIGGFFSSLVKWGSEVNMPPRAPGEISPPGANIDAWLGWLGFNQHSLDYMFQGNSILGEVTLYHWLFSFVCLGICGRLDLLAAHPPVVWRVVRHSDYRSHARLADSAIRFPQSVLRAGRHGRLDVEPARV